MLSISPRWMFIILLVMLCALESAQSDRVCSCDDCDIKNGITDHVFELHDRVTSLESSMDQLLQVQDQPRLIRDCSEVTKKGNGGVYQIQPEGASHPFNVTCSFDSEGKWTVLQQRMNGDTDFYRSWVEYKKGFGTNGLNTNLWMGLEYLHQITSQRQYSLRIDLVDFVNVNRHAKYSMFSIGDETSGYQLHINGHSGNLPDSMTGAMSLDGLKFTTADNDNDLYESDLYKGNCAVRYPSGWWLSACYHVNLNGEYRVPPHHTGPIGIQWKGATPGSNWWYSMKRSLMRIKPAFEN